MKGDRYSWMRRQNQRALLAARRAWLHRDKHQRRRERYQFRQLLTEAIAERRRSKYEMIRRNQNTRFGNFRRVLRCIFGFEDSGTRWSKDFYDVGPSTRKRLRGLATKIIVVLALVEQVSAAVQGLLSYFA